MGRDNMGSGKTGAVILRYSAEWEKLNAEMCSGELGSGKTGIGYMGHGEMGMGSGMIGSGKRVIGKIGKKWVVGNLILKTRVEVNEKMSAVVVNFIRLTFLTALRSRVRRRQLAREARRAAL